jgi:hypothetical protein
LPNRAILREILDGEESVVFSWANRIFAEQFILLLVASCAEAEAAFLSLTGPRAKDQGKVLSRYIPVEGLVAGLPLICIRRSTRV